MQSIAFFNEKILCGYSGYSSSEWGATYKQPMGFCLQKARFYGVVVALWILIPTTPVRSWLGAVIFFLFFTQSNNNIHTMYIHH